MTMRRAWRVLRWVVGEMFAQAPGRVSATIALCLLLTLSEGASVLLLPSLLELAGVIEGSPLPTPAGWLAGLLRLARLEPTLEIVLPLFVGLVAVRATAARAVARLTASVREELVERLRMRVYRAIVSAQWEYLVTRSPAAFAHVLSSEVARVGGMVSQFTEAAVALLMVAVYVALALRLSPVLAALVLVSAAGLGWVLRGILNRASELGTAAADARYRLHAAVSAHLSSMKTARSFDAMDRHAAEFADASRAMREVGTASSASESRLQHQLEVGSTIALALIVYVSVATLNLQPGLLLVLLYIFARIVPRLVQIYRLGQALMTALPTVESVRLVEEECNAAAQRQAESRSPVSFSRDVTFERVSYLYPTRGVVTRAVDDVSICIKAGCTTALVGPSGSGKTTMADLLMGLLTPTSGRILIDDAPLSIEVMEAWRHQIAYVPQDAFLFDDTIRANLLWACPEASEPELWEALRLAAVDGFVGSLPDGLDSAVGDRGVMVSGGERQRLAIARALLRKPQLLLLDEATSAVDVDSEERIKAALESLHHKLTIVMITHRPGAIRNADQIYVIDGGRATALRPSAGARRQ